ncbi:hypothetical protein KDH_77460 [Dictyobacter sp. S3.2.2.5]|uniref:Uncharacterized protein n=1 Tax=Dictyobacter halimunensis TaxID=3026934 RepID=A0ABQ6G6K4_9CHLR|nr:hypothetical protein KDH_77460 [Dictyobacter sp. S3.2.2.5]
MIECEEEIGRKVRIYAPTLHSLASIDCLMYTGQAGCIYVAGLRGYEATGERTNT